MVTDLLDRLCGRLREAHELSPGVLLGVDGPDGAGKTTLADALAERMTALRTSIDDFHRPAADRVTLRTFDLSTDMATDRHAITVGHRDVLIVDGVFLLRPELADLWTVSVYLRISPEESLRRALIRDVDLFGSAEQVRARYLTRYLPGQAIYRAEADPESMADIVVDNERADEPHILRWT